MHFSIYISIIFSIVATCAIWLTYVYKERQWMGKIHIQTFLHKNYKKYYPYKVPYVFHSDASFILLKFSLVSKHNLYVRIYGLYILSIQVHCKKG
jgi:hypothetical protein